VQICAGVSSLLARAARLSPTNRRRMASVGMAAGIAAAFNAPIAAITFTLEELIGDLDQTMLTGVIVAAALSAVIENTILGSNPVFHVNRAYKLGQCLIASLVRCAGPAGGDCLGDIHRFTALAARSIQAPDRSSQMGASGHRRSGHGLPGRGGAGALSPERHRRRSLQDTHAGADRLDGHTAGAGDGGFCVLKLAATVCSYSSGGAGGIFAPALFMGAMLGGAVGYIDVAVFHHSSDAIGAFAVVGMGAVFAGIVRAPMTSVLIVFEMTGGYGLVLPLMIANMSAFALGPSLAPHTGLRSAAGAGRYSIAPQNICLTAHPKPPIRLRLRCLPIRRREKRPNRNTAIRGNSCQPRAIQSNSVGNQRIDKQGRCAPIHSRSSHAHLIALMMLILGSY
jgi:CIC family chloride channel protein